MLIHKSIATYFFLVHFYNLDPNLGGKNNWDNKLQFPPKVGLKFEKKREKTFARHYISLLCYDTRYEIDDHILK